MSESTALTTDADRQLSTWLTPQSFEAAEKIAGLMASCGTMPKHMQNKGDAFRIVVQAAKWRMDPFAVAECTSLVHGRLCFEGKLVAAVLSSMNAIEGRLSYTFEGEGQAMKITVAGKVRGGKVETLSGTVALWRTETWKEENGQRKKIPNQWDKDPQSMLVYRGTRQWARLYTPEAMMGIYTPDEFEGEIREVEVERIHPGELVAARTTTAPTGDTAAEVKPAAPAVTTPPPAKKHPAIEAARALHKAIGKDRGNTDVIRRLCALHGGTDPVSVPEAKLDAFAKDVAALAVAVPEPGRLEDMLSTWEQAARESANEGTK